MPEPRCPAGDFRSTKIVWPGSFPQSYVPLAGKGRDGLSALAGNVDRVDGGRTIGVAREARRSEHLSMADYSQKPNLLDF